MSFFIKLRDMWGDMTLPVWTRILAFHILKIFTSSGRFLDDLASIDNPYLSHLRYQTDILHQIAPAPHNALYS